MVVAVAVLPMIGAGGFHIFKAESPGPIADKIVPRIKDTAKILYATYIIITLAEFILLMIGGMSPFEAMVHTFGTLGTGGFSTRNGSIGAFNSSYIFIVISIFMIMSGTNFSLYYSIYKGKWRDVLKNSELRLYLGIISVSVIVITINTNLSLYHDWFEAFKHSLFQTSSIITTTGYTTADYEQWPTFSQGILFVLMFVGGSAGSTGGSIKVMRILVLIKLLKRELTKILHPRAVLSVRLVENQWQMTHSLIFQVSLCYICLYSHLVQSLYHLKVLDFWERQVRSQQPLVILDQVLSLLDQHRLMLISQFIVKYSYPSSCCLDDLSYLQLLPC